MSGKMKIFISVGIILNILLCSGFYLYYRLDQVVTSLGQPGILFREAQLSPNVDNEFSADTIDDNMPGDDDRSSDTYSGSITYNAGEDYSQPVQMDGYGPGSVESRPSNDQIISDVQNKVGRPIEKKDLIRAGLIILRRLDMDEISFLYQAGKKDTHSPEEMQQARKILLDKLTSEDINILKELGSKYGKELDFL